MQGGKQDLWCSFKEESFWTRRRKISLWDHKIKNSNPHEARKPTEMRSESYKFARSPKRAKLGVPSKERKVFRKR